MKIYMVWWCQGTFDMELDSIWFDKDQAELQAESYRPPFKAIVKEKETEDDPDGSLC